MDDLLEALESDDEAQRIYAVEDIAELGDPNMSEHLLDRLIYEESQIVKDALIFALKRLDCSKYYEKIFEIFGSDEAYLRNAGVSIFGSEGEAAIPFLTANIDNTDKEIRKLIIDALFEIGEPAVLAIRACLFDEAINVKITAVEYLAKLNDLDSIDDMLELLDDNPDPMLKTTLLDSISHIGGNDAVKKALELLIEGTSEIQNIDSLYVSDLMDLIKKVGEWQDIRKIVNSLQDVTIYADDLIETVSEMKVQFSEILECEDIINAVIEIIKKKELNCVVRYNAVGLLLDEECKLVTDEKYFAIGKILSDQKDLLYPAVKLMARCNKKEAQQTIIKIQDETEDEELKKLCSNLLMSGA